MGCSTSNPVKEQGDGEQVDYQNIQEENPDYPLPYIPETKKREIWDNEVNIDILNKIENMPPGTESSYNGLLKYLSDGTTKDIHHVTAIYMWMKSQDYESELLDQNGFYQHNEKGTKRSAGRGSKVDPNQNESLDTPRGYMKMIKDGTGDFTTFFTILCRRSGIPCNILRGLGKDERYYIGMSEQHMVTKWTAIYVDQEWRLAHIQWAMDSRKDSNQNRTEDKISDFYFLTDPEDFAHLCHPEDFNWQLLDRPYSKKEFMMMPNFRPAAFFKDMAVVSPQHCTIKTSRSAAEIEIAFPKKTMETIEASFDFRFHQELTPNGDKASLTESKLPKKLDSFVFVNRKATKFCFEIQLPAAGKYLFDIHAKHFKKGTDKDEMLQNKDSKTESIFERLCQFRIIAELDPQDGDLEPLPDCPEHGWGPGPNCRNLGLVPLTHFDSYIYIRPGEFRDIRFRMKTKLDVQCQLTHNFLPIYQLVEQIEQETVKDEVHIRIRIPEEGTYAFKIYCRPKGTKEFNEACVYLLKQQVKSRFPEKYRDKMIRSRLEYHIEQHTTEKDLRDAIDMYHCYNVPDHGELKRGRDKLKHYWEVKRELTLAIRGRNIKNLTKWIERAKRSKYKDDLLDEIDKAESLEENMSRRNGYAHPIARMDEHAITEIHNYKHPPKVVHDVMKSTYILLGEEKEYLDIWEQIQYLMGRTGKDGLKKIIMNRRVEDVSMEQADDAELIILPYNLNKCREVSTEIGSFYKWSKQMIQGVNQRCMTERQRLEAEKELSGRETFRENFLDKEEYCRVESTSRDSCKEEKDSFAHEGNNNVLHESQNSIGSFQNNNECQDRILNNIDKEKKKDGVDSTTEKETNINENEHKYVTETKTDKRIEEEDSDAPDKISKEIDSRPNGDIFTEQTSSLDSKENVKEVGDTFNSTVDKTTHELSEHLFKIIAKIPAMVQSQPEDRQGLKPISYAGFKPISI